jgi:NAD(P)-dependent dehydrogenase (short-subunit alcohol dehydrogenase family)
MSQQFKGKVVLITGGSSGIGRATAVAFAREGASVVISARRKEESVETVRLAKGAGGSAEFIQADMAVTADIIRMIDEVVKRHGRLDIAFNNAGIEGTAAGTPNHEYPDDVWAQVIGINLTGVFLCMKHEIAQMVKQGGGAIVNMASVAGLVGTHVGVAYGASKFGVVGLTKCAALEYAAQNIRINAVCPAVIQTAMAERLVVNMGKGDPAIGQAILAMHPVGRFGTPEEVADAVLWLSSDRASFVTGHALPVDGGFVTP